MKFRWGLYNGSNKKRPYCEGHEREEEVEKRNKLTNYFQDSRNSTILSKKVMRVTGSYLFDVK